MLNDRLSESEQRAKLVEKELTKQEAMYEQRLITWQTLSETRQSLAAARQSALEAKSQLSQIDSEVVTQQNTNDRELRALQDRLSGAQRDVQALELKLNEHENIRSPANGRITEIKAVPGSRSPPDNR